MPLTNQPSLNPEEFGGMEGLLQQACEQLQIPRPTPPQPDAPLEEWATFYGIHPSRHRSRRILKKMVQRGHRHTQTIGDFADLINAYFTTPQQDWFKLDAVLDAGREASHE